MHVPYLAGGYIGIFLFCIWVDDVMQDMGPSGQPEWGDGLVLITNLVCQAYSTVQDKKYKILALELISELSNNLLWGLCFYIEEE